MIRHRSIEHQLQYRLRCLPRMNMRTDINFGFHNKRNWFSGKILRCHLSNIGEPWVRFPDYATSSAVYQLFFLPSSSFSIGEPSSSTSELISCQSISKRNWFSGKILRCH
ncbi:hypothetical protein DER45DRAFT_553853, partial [Fusarium avenaceum]